VVKTFERRYNLVLIRLVKFLESKELADFSWDCPPTIKFQEENKNGATCVNKTFPARYSTNIFPSRHLQLALE
jgi:hypothetical protein